MITTLTVEECYRHDAAREDKALYYTMVATRDRLNANLEVAHPTVDGEWLTKGADDGRSKFLREKLDWAIRELGVLFRADCTRAQALKAWHKVFNTRYFSEQLNDETAGQGLGRSGVEAGILIKGAEKAAERRPVDKRGGGRYA